MGLDAFHASFLPAGITTSFTSGMPSRDTCTQDPPGARREAVLQMPTIGWLSSLPPLASFAFGTCSANVLTL